MKETQSHNKTFGVSFGCLSYPISDQLKAAEYKFDPEIVMGFERSKEAIHTLMFAGILTDSMVDKCYRKLFIKVQAHVCKRNKLKVVKKRAI